MPLEEEVASFVARTLDGYTPSKVRDRKAIHDPTWGTNLFYEHEIALLDTPLLQRLRQIRQTGLSFLTYPSSTHTRFEHILGVIVVATRLAQRINEIDSRISMDHYKGELATIRMAALLHDCGHTFFSHASEEMYKWDKEMQALLHGKFAKCKPHEVLSYYIVSSEPFKKFFDKHISGPYPIKIDPDDLAQLIIGHPTSFGKKNLFIPHILNGSFDADKIDYIWRDAKFTGLQLAVNLDRLFYTLDIYEFPSRGYDITLTSSIPAEQILFSKMLLYHAVYHHHKISASHYMLQSLIEYIQDNNIEIKKGNSLADASDFLGFTDMDILNLPNTCSDPFIKNLVNNIKNRNLFKRALVLCKHSIDNYDYDECQQYLLTRLSQSPSGLQELRKDIIGRLPKSKKCTLYDVQISLPQLPSLREATQTYITGIFDPPIPLEKFFPVESWLRDYAEHKWRGHVFCLPHLQKDVYEAARSALKERGIDVNPNGALLCHISI